MTQASNSNINPVKGFAVTVWDEIGPNTLFHAGVSELALISAPARLYTMIGEKGFQDAKTMRPFGPIPTDDGSVLMLGRMLIDQVSSDKRIQAYGNPIMVLIFFQPTLENLVRKVVPEIQSKVDEIFDGILTINDLQDSQKAIANAIMAMTQGLNDQLPRLELKPISPAAMINMPENAARAARFLVENVRITKQEIVKKYNFSSEDAQEALDWLLENKFTKFDAEKDVYYIYPRKI